MRNKKIKTLTLDQCLTGLQWYALEVGDKEEISMLYAEADASLGVLTYSAESRKHAAGVGFITSHENKGQKKPVAAALLVASVETATIVAEIVDDKVWVAAVQNGMVVPGTDDFFSPTDAREQIVSLEEREEFALAGSFIIDERGQSSGDPPLIKTFSELVDGVDLKRSMPSMVGGGFSNFSGIFKIISILALIGGGAWYAADEYYFKPIQQQEALQAAAAANIAKAKLLLKTAREGEEPFAFYLKIEATLKTIPHTIPQGWKLQNTKCSNKGCDLFFLAADDFGGSLVEVADLLDLSPNDLKHGLDGKNFSIHVDFIENFTLSKNILSEMEYRASGRDSLGFSRPSKGDPLPVGTVFRPFFIDHLNNLVSIFSGSLKFNISESKAPVGISYSNISPDFFYKKGSWAIEGNIWPMTESLYQIGQLGGFITYFDMDYAQDRFKIEGYYLVK